MLISLFLQVLVLFPSSIKVLGSAPIFNVSYRALNHLSALFVQIKNIFITSPISRHYVDCTIVAFG